jgi:3-methyladenine DNA glycosylase/8-oxoguanine DNA glycosylase
MPASAIITPDGPFDLPLSLKAAASFLPPAGTIPRSLKLAVLLADQPAVVEIRQARKAPPVIEASATMSIPQHRLVELARWVTSGDLDLRRFYRIAACHPVMGPIAKRLRGLKPLRPPSLFEMALIAITEQQLSLAAAFHIRTRLVKRFGRPIGDLWVSPTPDVLAKASLRDLLSCGLSHRKAEYVRDFARCVSQGELALETLKHATEADVRDRLSACRGLGPWSVQYILLRGLGRFDCLPSDDVGLRRTIGRYMSRRRRLSPRQLERALSPFAPFRGLAAFYLAVDWRLQRRDSLARQPLKGSANDRSR